jgi:hypothetical protein
MRIIRKLLTGLFSIVLFLSLIGLALSTSSKINLSNESKTSDILNSTTLYQDFLNQVTSQADKSLNSTQSAPLNTEIKKAVSAALPQSEFNSYVNTFVKANYAWLQGNTAKPQFKIDLSANKTAFATKISSYVNQNLSNLPECDDVQLLQLEAVASSPLTLICRPPTLSIAQAASQVRGEVNNSSVFLANTVITPGSLNANNNNTGNAYYVSITKAPQAYKWTMRSPYIFAASSLISMFLVYVCIRRRSKRIKVIGYIILVSGLVLLLVRLSSGHIVTQANKHISNGYGIAEFKPALIDFANKLEANVMKTDLWFAIGYIVIALIILISHHFLKKRSPRTHKSKKNIEDLPANGKTSKSDSIKLSPHKNSSSYIDSISNDSSPKPKPKTAPPLPKIKTPSKNKRRLIQ